MQADNWAFSSFIGPMDYKFVTIHKKITWIWMGGFSLQLKICWLFKALDCTTNTQKDGLQCTDFFGGLHATHLLLCGMDMMHRWNIKTLNHIPIINYDFSETFFTAFICSPLSSQLSTNLCQTCGIIHTNYRFCFSLTREMWSTLNLCVMYECKRTAVRLAAQINSNL